MAEEDAMELRATMARWEMVRARWALGPDEEADLLGGTGFSGPPGRPASWRPATLERRIRLLVSLGDALDVVLRDEARVRAWLRRPCVIIGDQRPIDAMATSTVFIRALRDAAEAFAL